MEEEGGELSGGELAALHELAAQVAQPQQHTLGCKVEDHVRHAAAPCRRRSDVHARGALLAEGSRLMLGPREPAHQVDVLQPIFRKAHGVLPGAGKLLCRTPSALRPCSRAVHRSSDEQRPHCCAQLPGGPEHRHGAANDRRHVAHDVLQLRHHLRTERHVAIPCGSRSLVGWGRLLRTGFRSQPGSEDLSSERCAEALGGAVKDEGADGPRGGAEPEEEEAAGDGCIALARAGLDSVAQLSACAEVHEGRHDERPCAQQNARRLRTQVREDPEVMVCHGQAEGV
mmetsp:Transcript_5678/g.17525  ORF Transcript_5678/g.17525 Transcript_5678/m.17525 type:complete len:285 (+) Transcript_5678:648-1502(+)